MHRNMYPPSTRIQNTTQVHFCEIFRDLKITTWISQCTIHPQCCLCHIQQNISSGYTRKWVCVRGLYFWGKCCSNADLDHYICCDIKSSFLISPWTCVFRFVGSIDRTRRQVLVEYVMKCSVLYQREIERGRFVFTWRASVIVSGWFPQEFGGSLNVPTCKKDSPPW